MAWADSLNASRANNARPAADSMTMSDALGATRGKLCRMYDFLGGSSSLWVLAGTYALGATVYHNGVAYGCIGRDGGDASHEPGVGEHWTESWIVTSHLADSLGVRKGYLVRPGTDALGSYSDSYGAKLNYLARPATDSLGAYSDTLGVLFAYLARPSTDALGSYSDTLNATLAELGVTPLTFAATDTLDAWTDALAGLLAHRAALSDSGTPLGDSLAVFRTLAAAFLDGLGSYSDTLDARTSGPGDILVALSDALNNWADALAIKGWGITATRTCLAASLTGSDGRTMALYGADGRAVSLQGADGGH
jgi:hypothetical protein